MRPAPLGPGVAFYSNVRGVRPTFSSSNAVGFTLARLGTLRLRCRGGCCFQVGVGASNRGGRHAPVPIDADVDPIAERRRLAHLHEARCHEQNFEFHRGLEQFFESLGDEAEMRNARLASERERRQADRERQHLQM